MDNLNFELSPYEIDLLCESLSKFLTIVSKCSPYFECDEEPSKRFDDLEYLWDRLFEVRSANDRTNCGFYSLEIVKKWHSQID